MTVCILFYWPVLYLCGLHGTSNKLNWIELNHEEKVTFRNAYTRVDTKRICCVHAKLLWRGASVACNRPDQTARATVAWRAGTLCRGLRPTPKAEAPELAGPFIFISLNKTDNVLITWSWGVFVQPMFQWKNQYCQCVFVAEGMEHAKCMCHIVTVACLALQYFSSLSHKRHD